MGVIKAKCLRCSEEFGVNGKEVVGICPNCGDAYLTEKAVDNYCKALIAKARSSAPTGRGRTATAKRSGKARCARLNWLASVLCCIPVIIELVAVFVIPYVDALNQISYLSGWSWQALSLQFKISFGLVVGLGILIQLLGLFDKLGNLTGMFTQLVSFLLFVFAVFAANNNADSVYAQWGLAAFAPLSLLVAALRYLTEDGFGFLDTFGFLHYLPVALEVAAYTLFFWVFPMLFGHAPSLWMFVAITVITIAAIAVSSFWEDMRWIAIGAILVFAVLLCVLGWLGTVITSEWLEGGGIILLVILVIGGSIFLNWFIHRNDV